MEITLEQRVEEAAASAANRYSAEAYLFIFDVLDYISVHGPKSSSRRHVSPRDLLDGMRRYALARYGPLAGVVFEQWGVTSTMDFGKIVFALIENELLHQGEGDRLEDFANVYDFEVFETDYVPTIRPTNRCYACGCTGH